MSSTGFTIHHLPYGVITTPDNQTPILATAYEDYAINLATLAEKGLFEETPNFKILKDALGVSSQIIFIPFLPNSPFFTPPKPSPKQHTNQPHHHQRTTWNAFAALPQEIHQAFRQILKSYLTTRNPKSDPYASSWHRLDTITLHFPMRTTNYSDFYCSLEHATNCSAVFNFPVSPTWYTLPQVYNGRTSSLAVTNTPITRPCGIFPVPNKSSTTPAPATFQPEPKLDFELEMGVFISRPVPRGQRLPITEAKDHIFGIALLNDWSARCIQFYEIQPLGPFHSKGSLTSVAGWITPIEALEESALCPRAIAQSPAPLPHLSLPETHASTAAWSVELSATVIRAGQEYEFTRSNLNELYWSPLQQITHLASAGEGLSTGDIFGTGTLSSSRVNAEGEKTGLG